MTPDREMDRLLSERVMHWPKPEPEETEEILAKGWSSLRHWDLHRHSGESITDYKSYYWTPPPFSTSAIYSKLLRDKLAETWSWQMHSPFGSVPCFSVGIWPKGEEFDQFSFIGHGDTEEAAVIDCVREWLKSVGLEVPNADHE